MTRRTCDVKECSGKHYSLGLCRSHYYRVRRARAKVHGGTEEGRLHEKRFWSKASMGSDSDCWNWTGKLRCDGYGTFAINDINLRPHRFSYETVHGPMPDDQVIDHKCHNRACVNPSHLQAVSVELNNENRLGATSASGSGVRGIRQRPNGRWQARVRKSGTDYHGGTFDAKEEAEAAAIELRLRLLTNSLTDRSAA